MDLPILRYVDVVIGLAVATLLVCTIVTAITQVILASTYARSRNLRNGLADLVRQIDGTFLAENAEYIAERCLRHPMIARDDSFLGVVSTPWRNDIRKQKNKLPLPRMNPGNIVQREELILMLLEWAAEDGPLSQQDRELGKDKATELKLLTLRLNLRQALMNAGIGSPKHSLTQIREQIVKTENEHPAQSTGVNRAQAILAVAPSDFVARIYTWFDNAMIRNREHFALVAKIAASMVALVLVIVLQVDSIDLLKRLAQDDKLRADLVKEAELQTARLEKAQQDSKAAAQNTPEADQAKQKVEEASHERDEIAQSLAVLRQRNITPSYMVFEKVAQAQVCSDRLRVGPFSGFVRVGTNRHELTSNLRAGLEIHDLAVSIQRSGAPVAIYSVPPSCLVLVAKDSMSDSLEVASGSMPLAVWAEKRLDAYGVGKRIWGVLLSWILVSLGTPFWFDLLKKLLGLRTLMARKDDAETEQRVGQQAPIPAATAATTPTAAAGDDERGDLASTGAEG